MNLVSCCDLVTCFCLDHVFLYWNGSSRGLEWQNAKLDQNTTLFDETTTDRFLDSQHKNLLRNVNFTVAIQHLAGHRMLETSLRLCFVSTEERAFGLMDGKNMMTKERTKHHDDNHTCINATSSLWPHNMQDHWQTPSYMTRFMKCIACANKSEHAVEKS